MPFHFSPVNSTRSSTNVSRGSTQEVSDGREDLYETQMNPDYSTNFSGIKITKLDCIHLTQNSSVPEIVNHKYL
jgi:hypothetical protein